MNIRRAGADDAYGIAKVQVDTWESTYRGIVPEDYLRGMTYENRKEKWKDIIKKGMVYVAENEHGVIVGFSSGGPERSGEFSNYNAELYAIYIREEDQGKGLGRELITPVARELMEQGMFSMIVAVLAENPYRHFYEVLGAEHIAKMNVEINGKFMEEWIYGWTDISCLLEKEEG